MANRTARSGRTVLKLVHTWIGLIAGLAVSVIALTGSVILFRAEFERAALPKGVPGGIRTVGVDEAAREVARLRPDAQIRRVRLPARAGDPYIFQIESSGKGTERIVSDSGSGRVLGEIRAGWVEWTIDLHRNLLSGKQGRKAVGIAGILLFTLSATGLLMWLSGARNWRAWVSVRRQGPAVRFHYELHRAAGLWSYAFLAILSFTGIELAFPDTFRQAVQSVTGKPATTLAPKGMKAQERRPFDEYVRIARAAMPDGVPVELRLPGSGKGPVDLRLYRAGDLSPSGNHVYLDPATAGVVQVDRLADRPIGARFLAAMSPIHYGQFGGMTVKIAWALFALSPVLLFVTGLIAWWRPAKLTSTQPAREQSRSADYAQTVR